VFRILYVLTTAMFMLQCVQTTAEGPYKRSLCLEDTHDKNKSRWTILLLSLLVDVSDPNNTLKASIKFGTMCLVCGVSRQHHMCMVLGAVTTLEAAVVTTPNTIHMVLPCISRSLLT